MNNSRRTKIIAEGVALWAAVQDMPGNEVRGSKPLKAWEEWRATFPEFVEFVEQEQFALFDRVNAAF